MEGKTGTSSTRHTIVWFIHGEGNNLPLVPFLSKMCIFTSEHVVVMLQRFIILVDWG